MIGHHNTPDLSNARIAVIDDNRNFLHIMRSVLRASGVRESFEAVSPYQALEYLRANAVDLILTDYMMPEIDGFEMIAMIRNDARLPSRGVPIICVTGHSERKIVEEAIRAGADDFIVKPIRAIDIFRRIVKHLHDPLPRVESANYYGPDRRRGLNPGYGGPERRSAKLAA